MTNWFKTTATAVVLAALTFGLSSAAWADDPYVAQIGEAQYATLAEAIAAAQDGDTIELLADIQLSGAEQVAINKVGTYVIDGKGHTISPATDSAYAYQRFKFGESGQAYDTTRNYTLKNLTIAGFDNSNYFVRSEGCCVTFTDCVIRDNALASQANSRLMLNTHADFTLDGCLIKDNTSADSLIDFNSNANGDGTNALSVNNCLFEGNVNGGVAVIQIAEDRSVVVTDSTFDGNTVNASNNGAVVYFGDVGGDCTGCLFKDNIINYTTTSGYDDRVRVAGAIFTWAYGDNPGTISGNAFVNNSVVKQNANFLTCYAKAIYSGGYYNPQDLAGNYFGGSAPVIGQADKSTANNDIYAEYSSKAITASTYAESYAVNENGRGVTVTLYVPPVAQIGEVKYETLEAALTAAQTSGATIEILANSTEKPNHALEVLMGGDITLTAESPVRVEIAPTTRTSSVDNDGMAYIRSTSAEARRTFTVGENVTLAFPATAVGKGAMYIGYSSATPADMVVNGRLETYIPYVGSLSTLTVNPSGSIKSISEDLIVRWGSTVDIVGTGAEWSAVNPQAEFAYVELQGGVTTLKDTYAKGGAWVHIYNRNADKVDQYGATTLVLDNSILATSKINNQAKIALDLDSQIVTPVVQNTGSINIDATGITEPVKVIDYTGSGTMALADYGTVNVTAGEAYVEDNDLWVRKLPVAQVVRNNAVVSSHETLAAAVAAATTGDTIKMLSDVDENVSLKSWKNNAITFDLGGYTLTGQIIAPYGAKSDGIVIKNGNIVGRDSSSFYCLQFGYGSGNATLENLSVTQVSQNYRSYAVFFQQTDKSVALRNVTLDGRFYTANSGSTIAIESGVYKNSTGLSSAQIENKGIVSATGGTFYYNPTTPNNLLAHGYVATETTDSENVQCWIVGRGPSFATVTLADSTVTEYWDLDEAIAGLAEGATLTIKPGTYDFGNSSYSLPKNVTIVGVEENDTRVKITSKPTFNSANGLTIENIDFDGGYSWTPAVTVHGDATFKDCTITGENAIYYSTVNGTLTFDGCTLHGDTYGLNVGEGTGDVVIKDCEISGWTSFGNVGKTTITGTTFSDGDYNYLRFYQDAVIVDCTFNPEMEININTTGKKLLVIDSAFEDGTSVASAVGEGEDDSPIANNYVAVGTDVVLDEDGAITGGLFDIVNEALVAEGYAVCAGPNGKLRVGIPVAQIGDVKYVSFAEAIAAADAAVAAGEEDPAIAVLDATAEQSNPNWKIDNGYLVRKVYVAQIGNVKYESFAAAYEEAVDGDTIEIIADDRVSFAGATKELIIRKAITLTGAVDASGLPLYAIYGTSTYRGTGWGNAHDLSIRTQTGDVTIENLRFEEFGSEAETSLYTVPIWVGSAFTGLLTMRNVHVSKFNRNGITIQGGRFLIDGCTIDGAKEYGNVFTQGIELDHVSTGVITNSVVENITINYSTSWTPFGIAQCGHGEVTVVDCQVSSGGTGIICGGYTGAGGTVNTLNVVNCTVVSTGGNAIEVTDNSQSSARIYVSGGTYTGGVGVGVEGAAIAISSGYFDEYVQSKHCADGCLCTTKPTANGMYAVVPKATVTYTLGEGAPTGATAPAAFTYPSGDLAEVALKLPTYASEDYTFGGWKLGNPVVAALPAGTTGDVTLVATWTKATKIEIDIAVPTQEEPQAKETVEIKVTDEWVEANVDKAGETATAAEIKTALTNEQSNGLTGLENYLLGLDGTDTTAKVKVNSEQGTTTAMPVKNTIADKVQTADTGFKVQYSLDEVTEAGVAKAGGEGTKQETSDLSLDLAEATSGETTVSYYKMTATITKTVTTGNTETEVEVSTVKSENTIGVVAVKDAPATTIIGVPWKSLEDGEDIKLDNLVRTANLTPGDTMTAYDSTTKTYRMWELQETESGEKEWVPSTTVTPGSSTTSDEASDVSMARGSGVWLTRQKPDEPIYLVGQVATGTAAESVETSLETPEAGKQTWNIVASPSVEPVDVATLLKDKQTTDKVMVPTAGAPKNFIYLNGQWGYVSKEPVPGDPNGFRPVFVTTDTTIPACTGFFYLNGDSNDNDKKINWNANSNN